MATETRPINSADAGPVVRVALVVSEDPAVSAVRAALVVSEDPAVSAVQAALVVSEDPVVPAVRVALAVSEDPAVRVALVVSEDPVVPAVRAALVVSESPVVPVALERELVRVPVALKIKSVTTAHRRGLVPVPAAEDLVAAAETTREPAAAEAAKAWEAAE
jgi:hypothetical protein